MSFSNFEASASGWQLPATAPAGTSHTAGSYAGNTATASMHSSLVSIFESQCATTSAAKRQSLSGVLVIDL